MRSCARPSPISRGSRTVPPSSKGTPQRRLKTPRTASSSTIRRSHHSASSSPPATACPAIVAITGFVRSIRLIPSGASPSGSARFGRPWAIASQANARIGVLRALLASSDSQVQASCSTPRAGGAMRTSSPQFSSFVLGTVLGALAACGESAAPITPKVLAVTGGNLQSGCFADSLHDSLEVTLTGSDTKPFPGAAVAWQVTSGQATIRPVVDTTDATGRSRTQLSLGFVTTPTPIAVAATVGGLPPGVFAVTPAIAAYTLGQTTSSSLASTDCAFGDGSFIDYLTLGLASAQSFTLSLTSGTFDAVVWVFDASTPGIAANDDSANSAVLNSFLKVIAAPGDYIVGANSYNPGALGAYTLATTVTPVQVDSCLFDLFVTRGITTAQTVASTDCVDASGPYYADLFQVVLRSGQTITITERSAAFDAELFLLDPGGNSVASDDNSG